MSDIRKEVIEISSNNKFLVEKHISLKLKNAFNMREETICVQGRIDLENGDMIIEVKKASKWKHGMVSC